MNNTKEDLSRLRASIDAIDDQILTLLKQRMDIVKQVGKLKAKNSKGLSFIRAGREATMLRTLTRKMQGVFPPAAVATIWRMIISTSLNAEQHLSLAAYSTAHNQTCYWQAREYYGAFLPITQQDSTDRIISDVADGKVSVGILPLLDESGTPWWVRPREEKNDIYVFARLPFIDNPNSPEKPALAIANVLPEPTEDDISLFAVHTLLPFAKVQTLFKNAGLSAHLLAKTDGSYLVETSNFVATDDPNVAQIRKAIGGDSFVRLLGSYAVPIAIAKS